MAKIRILGLIPARGGSKGIPKKNLYLFNEKPLIQWTIESALESNLLDEIIVSTDDEDIANFSRSQGIEVPFKGTILGSRQFTNNGYCIKSFRKIEYF